MWGRGFQQRSIEELVKSELRQDPGGPPKRPRTWLGAAAALGLVVAAMTLVLVGDCAAPAEPPAPSPSADSAAAGPSTSAPPSPGRSPDETDGPSAS
jgi:hypothetical protein